MRDLGKFANSFSFIHHSFLWVLGWSYAVVAQELPGNHIHLKQAGPWIVPENFAVFTFGFMHYHVMTTSYALIN